MPVVRNADISEEDAVDTRFPCEPLIGRALSGRVSDDLQDESVVVLSKAGLDPGEELRKEGIRAEELWFASYHQTDRLGLVA
ncbi:Uncharacterised protein [Mycobacteroides abscessus]|nr:Uncharacterised protein [Mycobacteroides abscessus]